MRIIKNSIDDRQNDTNDSHCSDRMPIATAIIFYNNNSTRWLRETTVSVQEIDLEEYKCNEIGR